MAPRKTRNAQQPSLLKREIPQMPEGYYSSGPNPNLRRFVEEHATPYDPATDEYRVTAFDQPITTTKATAIYNMHTYWSKKPHDAIRQYIRHYTQPDDIVLDPFCGSGGTALAALMEGRAAIAIDLSPAATFITKNYCTPVDVDELQRAFDELERKVKPEMDWLYETRCDRCDGRATTAYTVYSYVFQCNRCLEKVPLFDCIDEEGTTTTGKPKKIKACPNCHKQGVVEEISTRSNERFDQVPMLVSYLCEEGCKPQRDKRSHNDEKTKKREYFEKFDLGKIREIEEKEIPHWYPPHRMMNVESDTEPWGDKWRAGTSNFRTVAELFTKRNLWALAAILDSIRSVADNQDVLLFAFTSNLLKASRMMAHNSDGIGRIQKGTYYLPQILHDINAWRFMREALGDLQSGYSQLQPVVVDLIVSTSDARELDIPNDSVDYIFTDPPYAGNVQYGELNFVWEAWLDYDTEWVDNEIIVNQTRGKSEADWSSMLTDAVSECFRVLKPGRWISLCYHDTSEGTWHLLQDLMSSIGFISEQADQAIFIDTATKTTNQYFAAKVTKRDLVISFRKPLLGEINVLLITGDEDQATFRDKAITLLADSLQTRPGATGDWLYDNLVSHMVRRTEFERHDFEELLLQVAEPVREPVIENLFDARNPDLFGTHETVRWYLKETADQIDEAESAREEAAADRLERYMRSEIDYDNAAYHDSGVHYSDLFEQYLPVNDKPRRLLQEWLPEFFFKTGEGTWRPPLTEEEREQKAALRTSGELRRIKRFARALQEGVPPAERDLPANVATAADWLRQCRRSGLYDLGRALYEKGGFDFASLDEEAELEVEEDYQICVRRS